MGRILGLRDPNVFRPLWVVDFPLLEWDEETGRYHAMHHPFTSPYEEDIPLFDTVRKQVPWAFRHDALAREAERHAMLWDEESYNFV